MSDDKVVPFPSSQPTGEFCLKCGDCGCTSFYALDNGAVECTNCKVRPSNGWWIPASVPQRLDQDDRATMVVTSGNAFAKRRTLQRADEAGCVAIVIMQSGGTVSTWADTDRIDGAEVWLTDQMGIALNLLLDKPANGQ